jgi:hypothetical protein
VEGFSDLVENRIIRFQRVLIVPHGSESSVDADQLVSLVHACTVKLPSGQPGSIVKRQLESASSASRLVVGSLGLSPTLHSTT